MNFDFDREIPRAGTASVKHDGREVYFGRGDVVPLWVADMDFAAPEAVVQALRARAKHPVYGYTQYPESLFEALMEWLKKRHGLEIEREWIVICPGVVPSLHAAVLAFAQAGEGVIVQPPVYFPFFSCVTDTARRLVLNPLRLEHGRYLFDLEHLDQCASAGARMLLLCSPHNPVGRVWSRKELSDVLEIARRHNLIILSDEIHADLIYPGKTHTAMATLDGNMHSVITAVAPSKTFNIPGLGLSVLIAPNPTYRAALHKAFDLLHVTASNPFSVVAFEAAYRTGEPWLDSLVDYLDETRDAVCHFLRERLPRIRLVEPEGTYLLWLDCRALGMDDKQLKHFFVHQAGVGMNPGTVFGEGGSGFMRMNIGAPRHIIINALERIAHAFESQNDLRGKEHKPMDKIVKTDKEWRKVLPQESFEITRQCSTERPFSGKYWDLHDKGLYRCICCGEALFDSEAKFDSGTGWPSFWQPVAEENIEKTDDSSHGMLRTEITCCRCGAHLGHVFEDGPKPTGLRYCLNSAALQFEPKA